MEEKKLTKGEDKKSIDVGLSQDEKDIISSASKTIGLTPTSYMRMSALKEARKINIEDTNSE